MWIENQKLEKPLYKTPCTVTKKKPNTTRNQFDPHACSRDQS